MNENERLRVVLFALTGFGNTVLEALLKDARVGVEAVFTVKYKNAFPHYKEKQLDVLCDERQIPCYYGLKVGSEEGIVLLRKHDPDLIIVATFKQILDQNVINLPKLGIVNLHPSLLPRYRGPSPTNAALLNDDEITGVTGHYLTEGLDEGNILLQRSVDIGETDNDGQLRRKLAMLAGEMVPELIGRFATSTKPVGTPQDHSLASPAPKPSVEDGYLETATDIQTIRRKMRAFNPLPGTSIRIGESRVIVDRYELFQDSRSNGVYNNDNFIDLAIDSQAIRLFKKVG